MPEIPEEYRGVKGLDADKEAVLAELRDAVVGTLNPDGTIHMTPVWFLYENGMVYFETNGRTRKARNVAERGWASVLVISTVDVIGMGKGRVIDGDEAKQINRRLRAKYLTPAGERPVGGRFERLDDVAVEITPTRWVSWSSAKLIEGLRELPEYSDDVVDDWYKPRDDE